MQFNKSSILGVKGFWWEEFIYMDFNYLIHNPRQGRFTLTLIETNTIVGYPDSLMEADEMAVEFLNRLFEKVVLE